MINSIHLYSLRNGEYSQFILDTLSFIQKNDPKKLMVEYQYDQLLAISHDIEKLFKMEQGSILSDELMALDERRDDAINGLTTIINGHAYSTDPEVKANAKLLANHLAIFGSGIAKDSFQSETSTIRNIIADWDQKPELLAALTALNLLPWKKELTEANNLFSQLYLTRAENAGSANPANIKSKRAEANNAFYKLRDRLNSYYDINEGAEPFGKTVNAINGLISYYNNLLARRGGNTTIENPGEEITPAA